MSVWVCLLGPSQGHTAPLASPAGSRHTEPQALLVSRAGRYRIPMNRTWMRERLEAFLALCDTYDVTYDMQHRSSRAIHGQKLSELNSQMNTEVPTVREIVKRLDPELVKDISGPSSMYGTTATRRAINSALGILRDQEEWKDNLGPDAPSLVADQFHAHVWGAAATIWDTGKYRVAVQQAAVSLSTHIATKAGSSLTERKHGS